MSDLPPALKARVDALKTGTMPSAPPGPGAILPITWAMLVLAVIPAVLGAVVEATATNRSDKGCLAVGFVVGGIFFFIHLICLAVDFSTPSPKTRTTPERAVKAYFGALRRKQYGRAYACLSPLDRIPDQRPVLALPTFDVKEKTYSFKDKDGFGKYWRTQAGLSTEVLGGYHKTITAKVLKVEEIRPGVAAVDLRLDMSGYPALATLGIFCGLMPAVILILVMTKRENYEVRKLLVQKDGLWWIVNGEFTHEGDEAIERLLLAS